MSWAREYSSLEFCDGGRLRPFVDCWGLVRLVYLEQRGVDLPSYGEISAYDLRKIAARIGDDTSSERWRKTESPKEFDVCVMLGTHGESLAKSVMHLGVMTSTDRVMHIEEGSGVLNLKTMHPMVKNRIVGYYEYLG
jgi:hypothetical protein